jgi:hypothetical protein
MECMAANPIKYPGYSPKTLTTVGQVINLTAKEALQKTSTAAVHLRLLPAERKMKCILIHQTIKGESFTLLAYYEKIVEKAFLDGS